MRKPSATADQTTEWRRYVFLRHKLPLRQSSPREPLSPAGGDSASGADTLLAAASRGSHYDLMFETAEGLLTWAVERLPVAGQLPQHAVGLPLHRAGYLEYEGPISGDRGSVQRVQAGTYQRASDPASKSVEHSQPGDSSADHFAFVCQGRDRDGQPVAQLVLLDRVDDDGWELRSIIAPPKYPTSSKEAK